VQIIIHIRVGTPVLYFGGSGYSGVRRSLNFRLDFVSQFASIKSLIRFAGQYSLILHQIGVL
jgi:hypothetical protein